MIKVFSFLFFFIKIVLSDVTLDCQFGTQKDDNQFKFEKLLRYNDELIIFTPEYFIQTKVPLIMNVSSRLLLMNTRPVLLNATNIFDSKFQNYLVSYYAWEKNLEYYFSGYDTLNLYTPQKKNNEYPLVLKKKQIDDQYTVLQGVKKNKLFYVFLHSNSDNSLPKKVQGYVTIDDRNILSYHLSHSPKITLVNSIQLGHTIDNFVPYFNDTASTNELLIVLLLIDSKLFHIANLFDFDLDKKFYEISLNKLFLCSDIIKNKKSLKGIFYHEENFFVFFDFYYLTVPESYLENGFNFTLQFYLDKKKISFKGIDEKEIYFETSETVWIRYIDNHFYLNLPTTISYIKFQERKNFFDIIFSRHKKIDFDCIRNFIKILDINYCFEEKTYFALNTEKNENFEVKNLFNQVSSINFDDDEELVLFFDYKKGKNLIMMTNFKIIIIELIAITRKPDYSLFIDFSNTTNFQVKKNCIYYNQCKNSIPKIDPNDEVKENDEEVDEKNDEKKDNIEENNDEDNDSEPFYRAPLIIFFVIFLAIISATVFAIFKYKPEIFIRTIKKNKSSSDKKPKNNLDKKKKLSSIKVKSKV